MSKQNEIPDGTWEEIFLIPEFEDIEKAHETPWTWCEDDVGDEEHPSVKYIRKDLAIPKKEIEGKITKALERVEHYKLNIKEAYDNYKMHNLQIREIEEANKASQIKIMEDCLLSLLNRIGKGE